MKVIKNILLIVIAVLFLSCEKENDKRFTEEKGSFVRFFLLVDNNNNVLEFPEKNGGLVTTSEYTKDNLKTLKIPVAVTTKNLENDVEITFSTSVSGISNYTITPSDKLTFTNKKLIDTIYIKVNERWDMSKNPEIKLSLTNSSDNSISLGLPNSNLSNKEVTINFTETNFSYSFDINRKEIEGTNKESFDFKVVFPNGFILDDVENTALFSTPSTFDYSIERKPITKEDEVSFTLTINENLAEDTSLDTFLTLIDLPNYVKGINESLQINKPIKIDREGTPVTNFYDLSNTFYRLFGEYWRPDNDNPGSCEWFSTSVYPKPVIVDKNNANGFLYSDNGTPNDESDDIYHHKYKLGFVGNSPPIGTNPFALRNIFSNASVVSPGFNITEAIEFFPKDGNNPSEGIVNVISQRLVFIRKTDDKAFNVPISGTGTYKLVDTTTNLWKMEMEILLDCTEINGEIVQRNYILYNNRNYPDPDTINVPCPTEVNL